MVAMEVWRTNLVRTQNNLSSPTSPSGMTSTPTSMTRQKMMSLTPDLLERKALERLQWGGHKNVIAAAHEVIWEEVFDDE